ncbi:glycosyltransferase [Telluribacter sp. SYSU D00476]|uniref:glycosyltransferase n=1 Tax=Telluribacter sp. SYSU D00476 TaxID=2811430 RepID=UPI001FF3D5DB|nr:glycosyltransferase [Telluribacter sp. SYSU D00476]
MSPVPDIAPVVVFCYNRPWHLQQTIQALQQNPLARRSRLIVFSDGARKDTDELAVREVRAYLATVGGFKEVEIVLSEVNRGLATSVIEGVSQVLDQYERVIVLEDDMVCTTDFLEYMNEALLTYRSRPDIFSVTGYAPPVQLPKDYPHDLYLAPRASSWGWGTWRDRWQQADWQVRDFESLLTNKQLRQRLTAGGEDLWPMLVKQQRGVISSWAVRWTWSQTRQGAYGLYPVRSKIRNIGTDGSGTNFTFATEAYGSELEEKKLAMPADLPPDVRVIEAFGRYYRLPFRLRIKNWLKYGIRPF